MPFRDREFEERKEIADNSGKGKLFKIIFTQKKKI